MSGTKYVLKNNTTLAQFFDYKTLSDAMWNYQVQLNPGQIKTIWAETGTLKIYNNGAITIEEQSTFPPTNHVTGGNNGTNTFIDYTNKSILVFSVLPNSTNLGYSILDFDNNVIVGPVDLGYDTSNSPSGYWYVDDIFPFTNSGYAIYLTNDDNNNKASIYLDERGTIIGQYSASTNNREYEVFNGKMAYFIDYANQIFNYSDGKTFKSREFNGNDYMFGIVSGYWDSNNNNSFVTYLSNGTYNTYTLITMNSEIPLVNWDSTYNEINVFQYSNSNFTTTLNYTIDDYYTFFNIYSSTGTILQTIDLTLNNIYNNFDLSFFGTNKMNIIFYNDNDNSIPYLIYTYDGETNTLLSTTHEKNNTFPNWNQHYNSLYGGETNFPSQDFHISFYREIDNYDSLYECDYYDVLSYFSGDTQYRSSYHINNDSTSILISRNNYFLGSSLMFFASDNDGGPIGLLKLLVITSDNTFYTNITPTGPLNSNTYNFNYYWTIGDTFIFMVFTNYTSSGTIYAYDSMGNQLDYKLFIDGWDYYDYSYGTFYITTSPNSYYFNTLNSKFTSISYYDNTFTPDNYYTDTFKKSSNMLLSRRDGGDFYVRLLTENNLSPEVVLPYPNCCFANLRIGKDLILYVYVNNDENIGINLYNLSFGLLQSLVVTQGSIQNSILDENRAWVQFQNGSVYTNYMISANGIKMVESTTNNNWRVPNDNYWWD